MSSQSTDLYESLKQLSKTQFDEICFYLQSEHGYDLKLISLDKVPLADSAMQLIQFLEQYENGFNHLQNTLEIQGQLTKSGNPFKEKRGQTPLILDIPSGLIPTLKSKPSSDGRPKPSQPLSQKERKPLRHYIYLSQSKLDMFWSQIRTSDIQKTADKLELDDLTELSKLEIIENYIRENFQVGDVYNSQTFFEGSLTMISSFINDGSYVYFGDIRHRVALVGSRKHMYGLSQKLIESFSDEFSYYLVPRIVESLQSSISDDLLTAQEMSDFRYNNYSLHIERVNKNLKGPPQQFMFLAKRLWQFSDCVLATPLYVAME
jgi:hypothetical protein